MNPNNYENQKLRGLKRKYEYVLKRGGCCERCGYNKNLSALEFHHKNPDEKDFQIDLRKFSNTSLDKLEVELDKCELLCANCHRELHNPDLTFDNINSILGDLENKLSFSNKKLKHTCKYCGKELQNYTTGKKYCSDECKWKDKGYPTLEQVNEEYKILKSWEKVAQHFGLTRKVINGIRKRQ